MIMLSNRLLKRISSMAYNTLDRMTKFPRMSAHIHTTDPKRMFLADQDVEFTDRRVLFKFDTVKVTLVFDVEYEEQEEDVCHCL